MDDQVLSLLRRQRHSFLNHLQVISGWLQLNQPDRARRYLDAVAGGVAADGQAVQNVSAPVGLAILELALEAETHGVRIEWRVQGTVPADIPVEPFRTAVMTALALAEKLKDEERVVTVMLGPDGFAVHTPEVPGKG